ncbi:MAG: TrmH family RNA methyltransferase [Dokdonella sp.]
MPEPLAESTRPDAKVHSAKNESRLYGVNACLAAFEKRPQDVRKVYLTETRIAAFKPVLAWCVQHRLGYRVVETADLDRLTGSRHHEGVCFDVRRRDTLTLDEFLDAQADQRMPSLLLWFDGVGNPHNFGAVLRSAAHFAAAGVLIAADSTLDATGAAARVAEGGAESLAIVRAVQTRATVERLQHAGYMIAATVPRDGASLYATTLPARLAFVLGAESAGMHTALVERADVRLTIPGSGAVESLNVAASASLLLGEYWRQHR